MNDQDRTRDGAEGTAGGPAAGQPPADDTHKTEELTKAGRKDLDPDEGSE